ncbi:acyltransferase family-domain-containing protein [Diplogelasinospora grovesii]|uniref:Acyltransferase family-domain-containing protein n=1 Tax=Diplogelasinospora grovesii TaxID=303347 RepID=A0AAN6N5S8_9PEZI|nr:acyltransferase family-domain-containing protein [Diplogelasinospora grovesii]
MPGDMGGILDSGEWEEMKQDWELYKEKDQTQWKPWKPKPALTRGHRRSMSRRQDEAEKLRPTAYLDGLRGFAAFLVYWHHHELWAHPPIQNLSFEMGFGYDHKYHFCAFPGIRNFFTGGHFAVSTFFVISGYVLSAKPMSLIHAGEQAKLADNLSSALFRRWMRLYMPLICTTFIYMTSWHALGRGGILWVDGAKPQSNYRDELWWWYAELKNFSFAFNAGGEPWLSYNFHLWSIPVEFRGSVVIYTCLLALSRCTRNARLLCQLGLIFYFLYIADGWYCAMFIAGMLLCDLDLLAKKDGLPRFFRWLEPYKQFIYYHLLVISIYLGGIPSHTWDVNDLQKNRGWYYLSLLKPQAVFDYKWFYLFWAATFLVAAIPRIKWLKSFFETWFCQYLGRVSFALYLVHGPVLWTLGDRLYTAVGWGKEAQLLHLPGWANKLPLPKSGPLGLEPAFLLPHSILLPVTFYCAELVTRFFDEPSVKFPQWLYRKATGAGAGAGASQGQQQTSNMLGCDARFVDGVLQCIGAPKNLPIAATLGDKCEGDLAFMGWNVGPHDARVFYGPKKPYTLFGSNGGFTCFGMWLQDFRVLVDWGYEMFTQDDFRVATELQRPPPYGFVEKNWFVFWDKDKQMYAHYDVAPKRVFARLGADGSMAGQDLAPFAAATDEKCMGRYLPKLAPELESIHQATNSLSITLCRRADKSCQENDGNTFIFTIFQHKTYYDFHSEYEPYVMMFRQRAPFEIYGISRKPIWIHGRQRSEGRRTDMFYVVSMSWKTRGQKYHGYLDDVLFLSFGIEDKESGGIDVLASDLLMGLGLCSEP